jgi:phosphoribosylaminoimidazolecarboxamide formyltransferase/IMP cyclohydrolase
MKIRQVIVLANPSQVASSIPSGLTQLGLQIRDRFSPDDNGFDSLLLCDPGFENTPNGSAILRQAVSCGCCILMDSQSQSSVLEEIGKTGEICEETRNNLAAYALYKCLESDARVLEALQNGASTMPRYVVNAFEKVQDLRYGENWHQRAALYRRNGALGLHKAKKLNGREMSYNNVVDAEAVLEMLIDLSQYDGIRVDRHLSVIVKHANPCGVAYGKSQEEAYRLSFATDPKSAFGGVIGFNQTVDVQTAAAIGNSFVEVLLAPGYEPEALQILMENKPNRRILDIGNLLEGVDLLYSGYYLKSIFGGIMLQDYDKGDLKEWRIVTLRPPTDAETRALRFAWKIAKYVRSNALVYTTENQTIGIGSGQVSRVDSARFGAEKAQEHNLCTVGTVAATDSFFPFRDGLDMTFAAGATAVIHPGGSIRDDEVINAANEHDMAMVFTGMRHFRH